jgi:hypothetical protein
MTAKSAPKERPLNVQAKEGETEPQSMARVAMEPHLRHGILAKTLTEKSIGKLPGEPQLADFTDAVLGRTANQSGLFLEAATQTMLAQAHSLDAIFTEMARRAAVNMGEYIGAAETYMRMALKAQAGSRATFEAVAKMHQPREQTVKHVHINEGGQAVVADNFHQHAGGQGIGKSNEQSHAARAAGDCAALPSPDPERDGVPIPSGSREKTLQNARRDEPGSAEGKS